ncbi:MAG: chromosome segregation protein SMC, partial [Chloroflexota bacterium]|nr:chromosome segregation protein SMC [Chloroflexota bacterium]
GYTNLRSRRTEDVIFAGSDKRSQLSMAEVVLTLDNRDGDLPLPYNEITITRRAFRSGESQYLINGGRVRLKDVQQLVAPLGQSYTIIGQGLVDAALSQRPDERRGLFEHAAGISGLRLRANDAERSLAEAAANAQRLRDILGELEPRVRSLERSARLAREYGTVRDRLFTLQQRYYWHLWTQSTAQLVAARETLRVADQMHDEREQIHERRSRQLGGQRSEERRLAEAQRQLAEAVISHERVLADARHSRALLDARVKSASERNADLQGRIDELQQEQVAAEDEGRRLDGEAAQVRTTIASIDTQLAELDATVETARRRRAELRGALEVVDKRLVAISRERAEADGARSSTDERLAALVADRERLAAQAAADRDRLAVLNANIDASERRASEIQSQIVTTVAALTAIEEAIARGREDIAERRSDLQSVEREIASVQTRLDVLERSHASGEGLYAGVRAVLRAVSRREIELPGLVGTLAETVEVPKELETAIEVALGGHLQDLIVEAWSDAQTAIAFLKHTNAGRATFQPLDTVRPGRRPSLTVQDGQLRGVASDLVTYPELVSPIVEQLLGRTLIVSDLDASRRILRSATGWTLVTLSGEITRPSGSVTGGGRAAEAGLLGRERERRGLPGSIATRLEDRTRLQADIEQVAVELNMRESDRQAQQADLDGLQRTLRELHADTERLQRERKDAQSTLDQSGSRAVEIDQRVQQIRDSVATLDERRSALESEQRDLHDERTRLDTRLASESDDVEVAAASLQADLAAMRERLRTTEAAAQRARERFAAAREASANRIAEITRLTDAAANDDQQRNEIGDEIAVLEQQLTEQQATVPPVTAERVEIAGSLAKAENDLNRAAEELREAERERDRASLRLARVQDEQVFLTERIRGDLEIADPSMLELSVSQDEAVPDENEISRLRERLRRMSNVGEDVLEQHDTESQRLQYLSGQLADVDEAAGGLRQVLAELNGKMTARFTETFREVAIAFEQTFSRLFGGGTARLVMNVNDDGAAGIDIVAQPPGKRLQNLTALSGGERALTAVALLIAIQRVNPSPFCLLDEVDAALDESNVVRFREQLQTLASETQVVVITHNRGTIEIADTLYGVSMGDDGVSQILSLRLADAVAQAREGA